MEAKQQLVVKKLLPMESCLNEIDKSIETTNKWIASNKQKLQIISQHCQMRNESATKTTGAEVKEQSLIKIIELSNLTEDINEMLAEKWQSISKLHDSLVKVYITQPNKSELSKDIDAAAIAS